MKHISQHINENLQHVVEAKKDDFKLFWETSRKKQKDRFIEELKDAGVDKKMKDAGIKAHVINGAADNNFDALPDAFVDLARPFFMYEFINEAADNAENGDVNEAFDSKLAEKLFKAIMDAADESRWFGESSNSEIKKAQNALKKAIKVNVDDFESVEKQEIDDIVDDIVDEWSYDEDREAVKSIVTAGVEQYNKK